MVSGEHDWLFPYGYYIRLPELTYRTRNVPLAQLLRVSATHQRSHRRTAKASSKLRLPQSGSLIILKCKWHVWCVILSGPFGTPVTFSQRCLLRSQGSSVRLSFYLSKGSHKSRSEAGCPSGVFFVFKEVRKGVKKQGKKRENSGEGSLKHEKRNGERTIRKEGRV